MKGTYTKLTNTGTQQDQGSAKIQAINDNIPIVVNLTLPSDYLDSLQTQRLPPPASPIVTPRGMNRTVAASYIGCSPRKFDGMVESGEMPSPRLIGTKKVWDRIELDDFFDSLPKPEDVGNDWDDC